MSVSEEVKTIWNLLSKSTNIPVLLFAGAISTVGGGFLNPFFAIHFMQQGINFFELGIVFSAASLFSLFLRPLMGYFSDIYGRRKLIVTFSFVVSVLTPLYIFVRNVTGLALLHSSRTVLSDSAQPALSAMVGDVAPKEGRATLFGVFSGVKSIVYVAALFGSGAVLAWGMEVKELFYITSLCFLISSVVLVLFLKETVEVEKVEKAHEPIQKNWLNQAAARVRVMVTARSSWGLVLYSFFFTFALGVYPMYIPLYVTRTFGIGPEFVGPIVAVSWLTFAVVQPFGGWLSDQWGKRKILIFMGLLLIIIFNTAMAVSSTLVWVIVFWGLIGIGDGMFRPVMNALVVDIVPPQNRGIYFGTIGTAGGAASILAPLVYGAVAQLYSIRQTFLITSVFFVLAMMTVMVLITEGKVVGEEG